MPFTRTLPANWRRTDALIAVTLAVVGALMAYASLVSGIAITQDSDPRWLMLSAVVLAAPLAWYRRYHTAIAIIIPAIYIVTGLTVGIVMYVFQIALNLVYYVVDVWCMYRRRTHV